MARGKGFQTIAAFQAGGATWGTAIEADAGTGIYTRKHRATGGITPIPNDSLSGAYFRKGSSAGNHTARVSFEADLAYQGLERVIANFFGAGGSPATVDTSGKQHVFEAADRDAVFGTFAYEGVKDTTVVEVPSVQFSQISLSGKSGEKMTFAAEGMGDTVGIASSVNTTTTIDNVTVTSYEPATFAQVSFLLNNQSAGSLASAPIYVGGISLTLDRPIKENVTTQRGNKSSLFIPGGFLTGRLKVDYNIVENGTGGNIAMITDHLAATAEKAKIVITSPTLAGAATVYYSHVIWLPNLRSIPGDIIPVEGADGIAWSQEFELEQATSSPTGFTSGYNDGVVWECFSTFADNPLL